MTAVVPPIADKFSSGGTLESDRLDVVSGGTGLAWLQVEYASVKSNLPRALEAAIGEIRRLYSSEVADRAEALAVESNLLGLPLVSVSPSPEGGVNFSYRTEVGRYAAIEFGHGGRIGLVLAPESGARPQVRMLEESIDSLISAARELSGFYRAQ